MLELVKRRCVQRRLLGRKVPHRLTTGDVNSHRRSVGIRVDLVPKSATNNDAFSFLHPTGADSAQMILIGLLANNLEVKRAVTHYHEHQRVGGRKQAKPLAQP